MLNLTRNNLVNLYPHQIQGINDILNSEPWFNNWGMSTGKTLGAIKAIEAIPEDRVLIVTPKKVIPHWIREIHRFSDMSYVSLGGSQTVRDKAKSLEATARIADDKIIFVVNYDIVWYPSMRSALKDANIQAIFLDESHRAKAHDSKASRWLWRLGENATRRVCLSGTPFANARRDIFGQYRFLDSSIFGKGWWAFRERYEQLRPLPGAAYIRVHDGDINVEEFDRKVASIMRVVRTEDVVEIPSVIHIDIPIYLPSKAMKRYRELESGFITEMDFGTITADNALVKGLRLHQIAGGSIIHDDASHLTHKEKFDTMVELARDYPGPFVVFHKFIAEGVEIENRLRKADFLVGAVNGSRDNLEEFQCGDLDCLVVQIDAGSEGIDLSRAAVATFFSNTFSHFRYEQAIARLVRNTNISNNVTFHHLVAQGTIDEDIYTALNKKGDVITQTIERVKSYGDLH